MTTTQSSDSIVKTDSLARVRTTPQRREELLQEFGRSGLSGAKFAALVGVKYSTFAQWASKRKRARPGEATSGSKADGAAQVRWLEAVLDRAQVQAGQDSPGLMVRLSSGARLEIAGLHQIELAAALLRALERPTASC